MCSDTTPSLLLRASIRTGLPYPAEIVAAVQALVEAGLSRRVAAERCGLRTDLVKSWARRFGWRRGDATGGGSRLPSPLWGGSSRREAPPGVGVGQEAPQAPLPAPPPPRLGLPAESVPPYRGKGRPRRPRRYPPEVVEAARVRVEGSRVGLERIGIELGARRETVGRWAKAFGWRRPAPPDRPGPGHFRSRRFGRAYGGDAVGAARDLVTGSALSTGEIAKRVGISRCTVWVWMKRGGWTRPVPVGRTRPPYGPEVVAAARELYCTTRLSTRMIAARAGTNPKRIYAWAQAGGWTRPRDLPDPHCRVRRREAIPRTPPASA